MGRRPLALALLVLTLAPGVGGAAPRRAARTPNRPAAAGRKPEARPAPGPRAIAKGAAGSPQAQRPPTLAEARAALAALVQDRTRRRFRHHWERAIAGLLRAARGPDTAPALLEAARARYALYRWSAIEADREAAIALATRAARHGAKDGAALAAAIRREAGDDHPAHAAAVKRPPSAPVRAPAPKASTRATGARPATAAAAPAPATPAPAAQASAVAEEEEDDTVESPPDPALEAAVRELSAPAHPRPLGDSGGAGAATVSDVRAWSSGDYTRVAIYLSHWVGWQKQELPAEGDRPRRLAVDLRPATLSGKAEARPIAGDQVDRVRTAQNDSETVRVVLDLAGSDAVQLFALEDPPRLIVDVGAHPRGRPAVAEAPHEAPASGGAPRPADVAAAAQPVPALLEEAPRGPIRRIVVDAGHGGYDPGAIGPSRVREKDVTLAIARRLARKLRADGFEVILTRDSDRYLALEERTALANTARGDLFVSIHANAHPRRSLTGVETYFLNVTDDRYAARLAARENGIGGEGQGEVARILTDLDAKASAGVSHRLAQLVQREVCTGVRARVGGVQDLGVKSALFYVLLGARMPAVLVETAFISNRDEERRLASQRYQDEVAAGVARAVVAFSRTDARVAAAR
ncbi:N-acetylmuramoyl-L-alanine amidase [Anaeromyxobacter oryzae]|uniref:N-acetylmuramoyl-L-alanine amidase n=1 Tax=Anaeromyxobacter oryzae TaxID=2918170 RepID=A0ABN6N1Y0_9BACT|nr:N-acetylmuramoyl-L-alanine amidase [Anaeromyxobacter oryzae]BDG06565.1 hypothetical protein AMOR_55610 [Anaeromyxobacter oryzae]